MAGAVLTDRNSIAAAQILRVNPHRVSDPAEGRKELPLIEKWFEFVGEKLPIGVKDEFDALKQRLADAG